MKGTVTLAEPIEAFGVEYPAGLKLEVTDVDEFGIQVAFPMPEGGHLVGTIGYRHVRERKHG